MGVYIIHIYQNSLINKEETLVLCKRSGKIGEFHSRTVPSAAAVSYSDVVVVCHDRREIIIHHTNGLTIADKLDISRFRRHHKQYIAEYFPQTLDIKRLLYVFKCMTRKKPRAYAPCLS